MQPDKPPIHRLKPERIQDQSVEVVQPTMSRFVALLEWIATWARRLRDLFRPGDSNQQS